MWCLVIPRNENLIPSSDIHTALFSRLKFLSISTGYFSDWIFFTYPSNTYGFASNAKFDGNWAVVLGSEAHGLSEDFNIYKKITIEKLGKIESLNASVACGIILDNFIHHQN